MEMIEDNEGTNGLNGIKGQLGWNKVVAVKKILEEGMKG